MEFDAIRPKRNHSFAFFSVAPPMALPPWSRRPAIHQCYRLHILLLYMIVRRTMSSSTSSPPSWRPWRRPRSEKGERGRLSALIPDGSMPSDSCRHPRRRKSCLLLRPLLFPRHPAVKLGPRGLARLRAKLLRREMRPRRRSETLVILGRRLAAATAEASRRGRCGS